LGYLQDGFELLHVKVHPCWALVGILQKWPELLGWFQVGKLITEGASQECRLSGQLKVESQGPTEMLLNFLLESNVYSAIETMDLLLGLNIGCHS